MFFSRLFPEVIFNVLRGADRTVPDQQIVHKLPCLAVFEVQRMLSGKDLLISKDFDSGVPLRFVPELPEFFLHRLRGDGFLQVPAGPEPERLRGVFVRLREKDQVEPGKHGAEDLTQDQSVQRFRLDPEKCRVRRGTAHGLKQFAGIPEDSYLFVRACLPQRLFQKYELF